jgi:reactive intermediate/imine deaminase
MDTMLRTLALLSCLLGAATAAKKTIIHVDGWPESPLYSHGVLVGDTLYVAGTVGVDMDAGALCAGGIGPETKCAFDNIAAVLDAAGTTLDNVVDCTVFLGTMDDYDAMNAVYETVFASEPPARAAFAAAGLAMNASAEFKCIATMP